MPDSPSSGAGAEDASREQRLGWILADCSDRLNAGGKLDPEAILRAHPDLAGDLALALHSLQQIDPDLNADPEPRVMGDFRLLRQVGRGGMGVVYEAWQASMERRVALKVLPTGIAADQKTFLRFMREARLAGRLDHPGIVSVHAMGVESDTPFYAMEYVEGETLAQVLARLGPAGSRGGDCGNEPPDSTFDTDEVTSLWCFRVAETFAGVAEALQHAHSRGIVHRDLKPSNLILDRTGRLRILDFGLARLEGQESLTGSGDLLGTPLYMSPEQAAPRKAHIDHRSDIYSLGATLYEVLTRRPPFRGRDHQDTLSQIVSRDPVSPRKLQARIPRELETITIKCLRKDPRDRYGTAEAMAQDLRRFVRGDPIEARPPSGWAKAGRRLARHRVKLLVSLIALLLVLTSGLLIHEVKSRRLLRDRGLYRERVIEAAMLLEMCELTARAGSDKTSEIDPQELFLSGDFLALAQEAGLNPLQTAVEKLTEAEALDPEGPEAPYYRARGLILLGEKEQACQELDRAVRSAPGFVPALAFRRDLDPARGPSAIEETGWAGTWRSAHRALRARDFPAAAEAYSRLLGQIEEAGEPYLGASVEFHLGKGKALLEHGRAAEAIESFVAARTLWPRAKVPQLLLGKAYHLKGESESGERTFQALHDQAGPQQDEVAIWVAALYKFLRDYPRGLEWARRLKQDSLRARLEVDFNVLLGNYREAIRLGRSAIGRFPDDGRTHHFLAVALLKDPRTFGEALTVARRAWGLDPKNADTLSLLATAYSENRDPRKAEELFLQAIDTNPREPRAYDHLGLLLQRSGRFEEAERRFREAVQIVEGSGGYHFLNPYNNLARILVERGKSEEAIQQFGKAMIFDPASAYPYQNLGLLYSRLGRLDEAEASLRKAIELVPRSTQAHHQLGALLLRRLRIEEAVLPLREALRLEPRFSPAACDLGRALEKLGRGAEAFAAYRAALKAGARDRELFESLISLERREGANGAFAAEWNGLVEEMAGALVEPPSPPPGILSLMALGLAHAGEQKDLGRAHQLAARAVEETRRRAPECMACLAEVEFQSGNLEAAVRLLEGAVLLPRAKADHKALLDGYRSRLFPRLASFTSVDWALTSALSEGIGVEEAVEALSGAGEELPPAILSALAARILLAEGHPAESLERLAEARLLSGPSRWISMRAADCHLAAGEPKLAAEELRRALESASLRGDPEILDRWLQVNLMDLGNSPHQILEALPAGEVSNPSLSVAEQDTGSYLEDCRWLVERLAEGAPIRINCGDGDCRGPDGEAWRRDCFYRGGLRRAPVRPELAVFDGHPVLQSARWFERDELRSGYRLPLPAGTYRITLRFSGLSGRNLPPPRMDIRIEGEPVLDRYDPTAAGVAVADERSFDMEVRDGALDIEIVPIDELGLISALEVLLLANH